MLQTTAMVLAEHLVSGAVAGVNTGAEFSRAVGHVVRGQPLSEGLALGHVVLHDTRVVVTELKAEDPEAETRRLETAVEELKASIDEMLEQGELATTGEHREVLEAYRMFAHDRGWLRRMKEAIRRGMTAEAAVERVQNDTRARMLRQADAYWHERLQATSTSSPTACCASCPAARVRTCAVADLPHDTVLVARTMGPADLLDYDRSRLRGLVLEDSGGQSHVAIVAKALGIAAVGNARGVMERVDQGNPDHRRCRAAARCTSARPARSSPPTATRPASGPPASQVSHAARQAGRHQGRPAHRAAHQCRAARWTCASRRSPAPTASACSAPSCSSWCRRRCRAWSARPRSTARSSTRPAGKPVVFRTLDVGGDKVLPYLRQPEEENPALGWRAIRLSLDRPGLLRTQVRALLRATAGQELRLLLPMVTTVGEVDMARAARSTASSTCCAAAARPIPPRCCSAP